MKASDKKEQFVVCGCGSGGTVTARGEVMVGVGTCDKCGALLGFDFAPPVLGVSVSDAAKTADKLV